MAADSTSWPCESHMNTFSTHKKYLPILWSKTYSTHIFMHVWSFCWQSWKLSNMACCTYISNLDGAQWQATFDSQIMTSTLQADARHSWTSWPAPTVAQRLSGRSKVKFEEDSNEGQLSCTTEYCEAARSGCLLKNMQNVLILSRQTHIWRS